MIMDDAVYKAELNKLNASASNPVNWTYQAAFIDEDNNVIPTLNITGIRIVSDFTGNITSYRFAHIQITKSNYFKLVATNRKKLKIKITAIQTNNIGNISSSNRQEYQMFDAFLLDNTSEAVEMRSGKLDGTHRDDLGSLQEIDVQLVDRGFNEFRLIEVAKPYKNVLLHTLLLGLFSRPVKSLEGSGKTNFNVTVVDPDNSERYYQLLIPNGIRLVDLPSYIQKEWGVYSAGISLFLHNSRWYIYPPYNIKRYHETVNTLTIINVPKNEMGANNNSYTWVGKELYIFATGDTKHLDRRDKHLDEVGGGFRSVKSANLLDHFVDTSNGVSAVDANKNYMEVYFDDRKQELYNLSSKTRMTSNVWYESSKIVSGMHNVVILTWEYSDHELIYPGMPLKLIYKYRDMPKQLLGVVAGIETSIEAPSRSSTDTRYVSKSVLTLYVEQVIE